MSNLLFILMMLFHANVVFEGDSRTYNDTWTLSVANEIQPIYSSVVASDGARWTTFEKRASEVDKLLTTSSKNILFVWGGLNAVKDKKTAEQIHSEMRAYSLNRQSAGWYVVVFTEIGANPDIKPTWDTVQPELNKLIRENWSEYADLLIDLAVYPQLQDYADITYFIDGVHLTEAGNQVVANAVTKTIYYEFYVPTMFKSL